MRLRALGVLGLCLAVAATCDDITEPPPDTCVQGATITIGADVAGAVAAGDCALPDGEGRVGDSYAFTLETQAVVRFDVTGTTETGIRIRDNSRTGEQDVVLHDNGLSEYASIAVLAPGSYTLDIAADENDAAGDYTIHSTLLTPPEQPIGCVQPPQHIRFAMVGVTVGGVVKAGDCPGGVNNAFDSYVVKFNAPGPRKITVTVSTGAAVEIRHVDDNSQAATPGSRNSAGDIVVQFAPTTGYYTISILTQGPGVTLNYTIKIE